MNSASVINSWPLSAEEGAQGIQKTAEERARQMKKRRAVISPLLFRIPETHEKLQGNSDMLISKCQ
jgi:hypothetical protein